MYATTSSTKFPASGLWPGAEPEVTVRADGSSLDEEEDFRYFGFGDCCVRFSVIPGAVSSMVLYGGIVPFNMETVGTKIRDADGDINSESADVKPPLPQVCCLC